MAAEKTGNLELPIFSAVILADDGIFLLCQTFYIIRVVFLQV